jgi:predicted RNase H-like HicB family nuclease
VDNGSHYEGLLREVLEPYEQVYTGNGDTLDEAFKNAYEAGKKGSGKHAFHVEHILLLGNNPLSGYAVVVRPHG